MASFTPGREYHFTLSDGRNLVLALLALGSTCAQYGRTLQPAPRSSFLPTAVSDRSSNQARRNLQAPEVGCAFSGPCEASP